MRDEGHEGVAQSFVAALEATRTSPESNDAWDHIEELAEVMQRPDEVATLYREILESELTHSLRTRLAERAVRFHEEWFGDTPGAVTSLLGRIIELDNEAEWAFERLAVVLTGTEQWDELLALYDRMLSVTKDPARRKKLLDDAAHVAKDFANAPDRAVDYLQGLLELDLDNDQLAASIERLLERQERYEDLILLWRSRLAVLGAEEGRATRVRIAECCIDRLHAPDRALEELRRLVSQSPGHEEGCQQLARLLALDEATSAVRRGALDLLRSNYEAANRPADVVSALEVALRFASDEDSVALHREAGARLAILGQSTEAMAHYSELLRLQPADADARKQLRQLAQRSGRHDLHSAALVAATEHCEDPQQRLNLLVEAAKLQRDRLQNTDEAIELYSRVLVSAQADPTTAISVAHELDELYAAAGRAQERLSVLEQLAGLERASTVRSSILGEAARLADSLGDPDRALAAWNRRLEMSHDDAEALDAVIEILERHERWNELETALGRRAETHALPEQRRADLVRIADVQANRLDNLEGAITTWLQVAEQFGHDDRTLAALDELMNSAGQFSELADVLASNAASIRTRAAWMLSRLGDIHREHLGKLEHAARFYSHALRLDPDDEVARAGLSNLIETPECAAEACEGLARAYQATDHWELLLEILEPRLRASTDTKEQATILVQAAPLFERRANRLDRALECLARAFPLRPEDLTLEHELCRLAAVTNLWARTADALHAAAQAENVPPGRAAHLRMQEGRIREEELGQPDAADAYEAAANHQPGIFGALTGICRVAANSGRWHSAARGLVKDALLHGRVDRRLLAHLESKAQEASDWGDLARELAEAVAAAEELDPDQARFLESKVAQWYRDHLDDLASSEEAARRALELAPDDIATLQLLVGAQRREPGPALVSSLLRLDALVRDNLDPLREAAEIALARPDLDDGRVREILQRLYRKSANLWNAPDQPTGTHGAEACTTWAVDQLVAHLTEHKELAGAAHLLIRAAKLPFPPETRRAYLHRSAELLEEHGDLGRAIELFRDALVETPNDRQLVVHIADLCRREGRLMGLLEMLRRELTLTDDDTRRLEVRIQIADLIGNLEQADGRVAALMANLEEVAGHQASLDALAPLLIERGRHAELADILTAQAHRLQQSGDTERAALLWGQVARLAETPVDDLPRAIAAHRCVVDLRPNHDSLDALARLHGQREEFAEEAVWLRRRLEQAEATERVALLIKLARAQVRARHELDAVTTLETAFAEAPRNAEVRKMLLRLHREREAWEPLARTLATAAEHVADDDMVLRYAREAATIYHDRLRTPQRAVPVLERATQLAPTDRHLRTLLAESLRAEGRLPEARELLHGLVADFGRRRSPERASIHLLLARVCHTAGDTAEAVEQLETASKMDAGSVVILQMLADLARESGELERAERAYRTLLLNVRRTPSAGRDLEQIGPAETLLELSSIAKERGEGQQAEELLESALEALAQDDSEAARIQAVLGKRDDDVLLHRVLQARLAHATSNHRKAEILSDLADLFETRLDRAADGLESRLQAVELDPSSPILHQAARDAAHRLEKPKSYEELVQGLLDRTRRGTDAHARCELLLRLGEVAEKDHEDLDRATELYGQAEATGVRQVDVWRSAARVAAARGDEEEHKRLLEQLTRVGEDQRETRVDAYYRLAEVQLASPETLDQGVDALRKALADEPRYERAGMLLLRATEANEHHDGLLAIYEQVARKAGDEAMLLHYLERRAAHPDATADQVQEAAKLALSLGEEERTEQLYLRAVDIAEGLLDGKRRVAWALLGLAARRKEAGDLAAAVKWLGEASEVADQESVFALGEEIAEHFSQTGGDLTLAAKLYERLLERDPTAKKAWQRLAIIYRKLGDIDRLERLVDEILDGLEDPRQRNSLRLEFARGLLETQARRDDAVEVLHTVLLEEPEHDDAQTLLADYLERSGKEHELVELLRRQLAAAQSRSDLTAVKNCSLRLGGRLKAQDPAEALTVLQSALQTNPGDAELIEAVLQHFPEDHDPLERAKLLERLIETKEGDPAAKLGLQVSAMYEALGEGEAAVHALQVAYRRAPRNTVLQQRLESIYRKREDHGGLAAMMLTAADAQEQPGDRVALLRQVAAIQATELDDASAAADTLIRASDVTPDDIQLQAELAAMLSAAGRSREAIAKLDDLIERTTADDNMRLSLLRSRADMRSVVGDETGSVADLEAAYALDWTTVAHDLEAALERVRLRAAEHRDRDAERAATLRKVAVIQQGGRREEARELLVDWSDRERKDVEALRMLRDIETDDQSWEALAKTCTRLVALERGDEQIHAALRLAYACEQLGRPEDARRGLEHARSKQPENPHLREELRQIYQRTGAHAEQAAMLLEDAEQTDDDEQRADLLLAAGELFLRVAEGEPATRALKEALVLRPGDAAISTVLANACLAAGEMNEAEDVLDQAIAACKGRRSPELALLQHAKSHVANSRGDQAARLEWLQQAFACDTKNGHIAVELADVAESMQEWDLAVRALRSLALMQEESPLPKAQAYLRQGRISHVRGDRQRAVLWARKARQEDPSEPSVAEFLVELGET